MKHKVEKFIKLRHNKFKTIKLDGQLKEQFIRELKQTNQLEEFRGVCKSNPILFIESMLTIVNKKGKRLPLKLNEAQTFVYEKLKSEEFKGVYYLPKARQLGMSVLISALNLTLFATSEEFSSYVGSLDRLSSKKMFTSKYKGYYRDVPESYWNKDEAIEYSNVNELRTIYGKAILCSVLGENSGRGDTIQFGHLSEIAFSDLEGVMKSLDASLTPDSLLILESTSNGKMENDGSPNGWYDRILRHSNGELPKNHYTIFLPWYLADEYRTPTELATDKFWEFMKGNFEANDEVLTGLANELPKLIEIYGKDIAIEKALFYFNKYQTLGIVVQQEYPSNIWESFVSANGSLVPYEVVKEQEKHLRRGRTTTVGNFEITTLASLKSGHSYGIGIDVGTGSGRDFTSIVVVDFTAKEVVCVARSNTADFIEQSMMVDRVSRNYGRPITVIERNSIGTALIQLVSRLGVRLYKSKGVVNNLKKGIEQYGFQTSLDSKVIILEKLRQKMEGGELVVRSESLLIQISSVEVDKKTGRAIAHVPDDVMALALSLEAEFDVVMRSSILKAPVIGIKKKQNREVLEVKNGKVIVSKCVNLGGM